MILSCDPISIIDVSNFGTSRSSMRGVIIASILEGFERGWSWFNFCNLGLILGIALTFYSSMEKDQTKVIKSRELIPNS